MDIRQFSDGAATVLSDDLVTGFWSNRALFAFMLLIMELRLGIMIVSGVNMYLLKEALPVAEKKNRRPGLIVPIVLAVLIIGIIAYSCLSELTLKSEPLIVGNTAGNLYNYGLFCDDGERIYFSNYLDQGLLYSMSRDLDDFKYITNDVARYINHDDHYLYYSRMNNLKDTSARSIFVFYSNGVFRISKDGLRQRMLWNNPIGSLLYFNGHVFYQYYNEGEKLSIHMTDIDGKEHIKLDSDESVAVSVYNKNVYYSAVTRNRNLYSINPEMQMTVKALDGSFFNPVVTDGGVYYIDVEDKYRIKYCKLNGSETETVVDEKCSSYNMTEDGRFIYYQVDENSDRNGVYMLDRRSGESICLRQGNYKWINLAGDYCFFYDSNETTVYCGRIGGGSVSIFNPPVLKKR